ncbi:hypothetical protein HHI36_016985 [Cryptolaemus montrouzieri]|uniref:Uncharacterized protein n=1 Tax=Cryptolaemus montrouzieri TaxID=559131 RepID=A0ABD2NLJ4_9CUCU
MLVCSNCAKSVADRDQNIQYDACKGLMHVTCTGLRDEDRVTWQKIKEIKVISMLCNKCNSNIEAFSNFRQLVQPFQADIQVKMDEINQKALSFDQKLSAIDSKISKVDYISSAQFADNIANEAVDRINRAKNFIIRGVPESAGDLSTKKKHDIEIVNEVLRNLECGSTPTTLFRIGQSKNKHPRMIKVVMNNEEFYGITTN